MQTSSQHGEKDKLRRLLNTLRQGMGGCFACAYGWKEDLDDAGMLIVMDVVGETVCGNNQ